MWSKLTVASRNVIHKFQTFVLKLYYYHICLIWDQKMSNIETITVIWSADKVQLEVIILVHSAQRVKRVKRWVIYNTSRINHWRLIVCVKLVIIMESSTFCSILIKNELQVGEIHCDFTSLFVCASQVTMPMDQTDQHSMYFFCWDQVFQGIFVCCIPHEKRCICWTVNIFKCWIILQCYLFSTFFIEPLLIIYYC